MRLEKPSAIDKRQWLTALGVRGEPDLKLREELLSAEKELLDASAPQGVCRVIGLTEITLNGEAIKKHLRHCQEILLMGITLGVSVDNLIKTAQIRDMAKAVIYDCGASILAEQVADCYQQDVKGQIGAFLTGRYSPGYGDLPMETQEELLRILDGPRKIGLTVTESHILVPRKSITAILGISDRPVEGYLATCDECKLKETCTLRKEGKTCVDKS